MKKFQTKVEVAFRTPYIPGNGIDKDTLKTMKKEISRMRSILIKRQERLAKSYYGADERALQYIKSVKVANLKAKNQIQDIWHRFYYMINGANSSISGKREADKKRIKSLQQSGLFGREFLKSLKTDVQRSRFLSFLGSMVEQYGNSLPYQEMSQVYYQNQELTDAEIESKFSEYVASHYM